MPEKSSKTVMRSKISFLIAFQILFVFICYSTGFSEGGLTWGRFRFSPELSISEIYTDNVYLTNTDERDDTITTTSPKLSIDFAFAPRNYITLSYGGDFRSYRKSDNLKKDIHRTGLFWTLTTTKGSSFKLGAKVDYDSIQPYSENDRHKDFVKREAFADTMFKLGAFTDFGIKYSHLSERFDSPLYDKDEFDIDTITLSVMYKRLPATAFLIEYIYDHLNNKNLLVDMDTHIFFIGAQWDPTEKLSGHLKAGYYQTRLKDSNDSSGFAMDTDLAYQVSDFTQLKVTAFRRLIRSLWVARETGIFYVSTGGSLSALYRRWDPITVSMDFSYMNNKFKPQDTMTVTEQKDNFFSAGFNAKYSLRNWLSFLLTYQYRINDSNFAEVDYKENRAEFRLTLTI